MSMVGKMRAWGSRRDEAEASAEGDPVPGKSGGELDGPEVEDGAAIVGDVASEATRRVVKGERREERVEGDDGGFLERVGGGDEDIHRGQLLQGAGAMAMGGGGQEQQPGGVNEALYEAQPGDKGEVGLEGEPELAEEGGGEEEEVEAGHVMVMVEVEVEVVIIVGRAEGEEEEEEEEGAEDEGRFCVALMGLYARIRHQLMKGKLKLKLRRSGGHGWGEWAELQVVTNTHACLAPFSIKIICKIEKERIIVMWFTR